MKKIQLRKIKLSNFKSLNLEVSFNEGSTTISGKNGIGKTSLASAFYWLLSSYTSPYVPKNFALFDDRVELTHDTPLAKVKAWLKIGDYEYTIEKTAEAKFTRPKGSIEWVKASSDTYTIYVDDIETSSTAFNEWIENNICPIAILPYLLSGDFFSALVEENKNKARDVLSSIVGEINPEDFKGDYSCIEELMVRHTTAEIVEMSKRKKKPLEDRQNIIPIEIDRKEERLSELKAMDFSYYEKEIEMAKARIEAIDGLLLGNADAIKPIVEHNREIENKIADLRRKLMDGRIGHETKEKARTSEIKAKINEVKRYNDDIERENAKRLKEWRNSLTEGAWLEDEMKVLENYLNTLRDKRDEVKNRVFTEDHCTYCGAKLDPIEIEKNRDSFNYNKEKELEAIIAEGKATKEKLEKKQKEYAELAGRTEEPPTLLEKKPIAELEEALKRVEDTFVPYEDTVEHDEIYAQIKACEGELRDIPSNDNDALTREKRELIEKLSELSRKLGLKDEIEKIEKAILDLKVELRNVANSIALLEKHIFLAKAWEQERNEIVSYRINGKMKKARFEMWSTQKNGEQVPDLILTNEKGVRFSSTNFANQIELRLDLQELFCKTFEVDMPRFIDESAVFSPSNLPTFEDTQAIYLFASDEPTLCVR